MPELEEGEDGTASPPPEEAEDHPEEKPQKSYETILAQQVRQASPELRRPAKGLLLSSMAAGLEIGVGPFMMALILSLTRGVYSHPTVEILEAFAYSIGFVLVMVGRSELFTEHTSLAIQPVLAREASVLALLRLWGLVLLGNLLGAAAFAGFAAHLGPRLGVMTEESLAELAHNLVTHSAGTIFLSAVMAGWMMGLLAWVVTASRETISQIVVVTLITTAIGLAHLHHSVAGTVEVLMGVFIGQASVADFLHFFTWAVLGNAVGGTVFVALVKFGHAGGRQRAWHAAGGVAPPERGLHAPRVW